MAKKRKSNKFSAVIKSPKTKKSKGRFFNKKTKKFIFSKKGVLLLLVVAGIVASSLYALFGGKFVISSITVEGAGAVSEEEIITRFNEFAEQKTFVFLKNNNTLIFPKEEFRTRVLSEFPKIKSLEVNVSLPDAITIVTKEREQEGIWCSFYQNPQTPQCFFYDTVGVIYESAPNVSRGSLIKIIRDTRHIEPEEGTRVLSADLLGYINNLIETLSLAYQSPSYIYIKNSDEIHAGFSRTGDTQNQTPTWEAYFSRSQDLVESVENLVLVIEEEIGPGISEIQYIDVRLGTKIFYQ